MLVLSRKKDEIIRIGEHIELIVVDIRGDKVRLGMKLTTGWDEVRFHNGVRVYGLIFEG